MQNREYHDKRDAPAIIAQKQLDSDFDALLHMAASHPIDWLLENGARSVSQYLPDDKAYYDEMLKWYKSWYSINAFSVDDNGYKKLFASIYQMLQQNAADFSALYRSLCDNRSRYSLKIILQHWLTFTPNLRKTGFEATFAHYFDLDLIGCTPDEVFVDCGAYDGDSVISFIQSYGTDYKRIYAYELTPSTFEKLKANVSMYENILCVNKGVADKASQMPFLDVGGTQGGNRIWNTGDTLIQLAALDEDIQEDITFIKMDIEGAERSALLGAQHHIRRTHPKLAISLYHFHSDIIQLPALIQEIDPTYRFYLRHSGGLPFPTEYVLIAI